MYWVGDLILPFILLAFLLYTTQEEAQGENEKQQQQQNKNGSNNRIKSKIPKERSISGGEIEHYFFFTVKKTKGKNK